MCTNKTGFILCFKLHGLSSSLLSFFSSVIHSFTVFCLLRSYHFKYVMVFCVFLHNSWNSCPVNSLFHFSHFSASKEKLSLISRGLSPFFVLLCSFQFCFPCTITQFLITPQALSFYQRMYFIRMMLTASLFTAVFPINTTAILLQDAYTDLSVTP